MYRAAARIVEEILEGAMSFDFGCKFSNQGHLMIRNP